MAVNAYEQNEIEPYSLLLKTLDMMSTTCERGVKVLHVHVRQAHSTIANSSFRAFRPGP